MGRPTRSGGGGGSSRSRSSGSGGSRSRGSSSSRPTRSYSSSSSRSSRSYGGYGGSSGINLNLGGSGYRGYRSSGGVNINLGGSGGYSRSGSGSMLPKPISIVLTIAIVLLVLTTLLIPAARPNFSSSPRSTIAREKIESGYGFDYKCITDELGYFDSIDSAGKQLKYFHQETGVQPYIYLKKYDTSLASLTQKEEYAKQLYATMFPNRSDIFLYVYFESSNPNDIGDEAFWIGSQAGAIMDSEAQDIFFSKLGGYWDNASLSMDEVYAKTFSSTADAIMKVDRGNTVFYIVLVVSVVISIIVVTSFYKLKEKNRRAKEEAEETERILKTDIGGLAKVTGEDDLVNKYN